MRTPRQQTSSVSIGLTPLIDVVFILLIFFMLVTNFDGLRLIDLSVTSGKGKISAVKQKSFSIEVVGNGQCRFAKNAVPCRDVRKTIESAENISLIQTDKPVTLYLKPTEETSLQDLLSAIDDLSASGVRNVLLAGGKS